MRPLIRDQPGRRRTQRFGPRSYANARYVIWALKNGASGYVMKQAMPTEPMRAMRTVVAGRRYLSKPLSRGAMDAWLQRAESVTPDPYGPLTGREREVLQLISEGLNNQVHLIRYVLAWDILVLPAALRGWRARAPKVGPRIDERGPSGLVSPLHVIVQDRHARSGLPGREVPKLLIAG